MTPDEFRKLQERRSKRFKAELAKLEEQLSALKQYVEKRNLVREKLWEKERQLSDPTGAPSIWKGEFGYQLFLTVEDIRERTGCTTKAALTALRTKIEWPPHEEFSKLANYSVKELQVRYSEAKPHWEEWRHRRPHPTLFRPSRTRVNPMIKMHFRKPPVEAVLRT